MNGTAEPLFVDRLTQCSMDLVISKQGDSASPSVNTQTRWLEYRWRWRSLAVVAAYFLLGMVAYWPVLTGIASKSSGSRYRDFIQSVWFIGWGQHALVHGLNPFFSSAMYAPTGVNLLENTSSPLLALLTAPLAVVTSPLVIGNLLMVIGMPLSATAAYVVLRKWQLWWPAAAIGGLTYGFSAYMLGQGLAHPELLFVPLPPFIVMTVVCIFEGHGTPRRLGIQLGLLLVAQYLISPEVLVTVILLVFIGVVFSSIRRPSAVPAKVRTAAAPVIMALGLAAVLLAYPLWFMFDGPQHFTGSTFPVRNPYYNDLLAFIFPGTLQRVSLGLHLGSSGFITPQQVVEDGAYIGLPLLMVIAFLCWHSRRTYRMQLSAALFVASLVLSLGPYLSINGAVTHIPLPFVVLAHIPIMDNILASRISLETSACMAAMIAFGLDDLHINKLLVSPNRAIPHSKSRDRWVIAITVLVLAVLVLTEFPRWPYPTTPARGLPAKINRAIPPGDPVAITYPYADGPALASPLLWQAEDGFRFRFTGGYGHHPAANGRVDRKPADSTNLMVEFLMTHQSGCPCPSAPIALDVVATRQIIAEDHVELVIVARSVRGSRPVVRLFEKVLGPPTITSDGVSLWIEKRKDGAR